MKHPLLLLCLFTLTAPAFAALKAADLNHYEAAQKLYLEGNYPAALAAAEKMGSGDRETRAARAFFLAGTYAKMQAFDKALPYFKEAKDSGAVAPNFAYDYGQAFFAAHQLAEAEAQFIESIKSKFKVAASAYYVGYIRQLQENYPGAKDFYQRIQRLGTDPDQVKQPALLQMAEIEYERAQTVAPKEKRHDVLRMEVLPLFELVRSHAPGTPSYTQANARINEIERETAPVAERMANGIPLPIKPYSLRLSQDFAYDSNVITEADDAIVQVSNKDSVVSRTALLTKYQWNYARRFSFIPELYAAGIFHSRRSEPRVHQNDNVTLAPALRTKYEHMSLGAPATAIFDIEFNYMLRDYRQAHQLPFYSRFWNLSLGERVKWFKTGTTTLKFSFKFYENYDPSRNSLSPAVTLQQNVRIFGAYDLQNSLTADYLRARDDINDESNYRLRHVVTFPKLFWKMDFTPSLAFNLKDTMKQKGTRGNEFLVNPSALLSREFAKNWEGNFEYAFSRNFSKSKDQYQYSKHEVRTGIAYNL